MKFGTQANTDISELTAQDRSYLIQRRTQIDEKYVDVIDDLVLVAEVGNAATWGTEPLAALAHLRESMSNFNINVEDELAAICENLQRTKLGVRWQKEGRPGYTETGAGEKKELEAQDAWVSERIAEGSCAVSLKLPEDRRGAKKDAVSGVNANPPWASVAAQRSRALSEEKRCHPAAAVTASAAKRRPLRHDPERYVPGATSTLAALFSKEGSAPPPTFLATPSEQSNRKQQVQAAARGRRQRMMAAKHPEAERPKSQPTRRGPAVASRFMPEGAATVEVVVQKAAGDPIRIEFDPETLLLLEVRNGAGASEFAAAGVSKGATRNMQIAAVSTSDEVPPFPTTSSITSAAALRRALADATSAPRVAFLLEPFNHRRQVEKRRSEFREKMCGPHSRK